MNKEAIEETFGKTNMAILFRWLPAAAASLDGTQKINTQTHPPIKAMVLHRRLATKECDKALYQFVIAIHPFICDSIPPSLQISLRKSIYFYPLGHLLMYLFSPSIYLPVCLSAYLSKQKPSIKQINQLPIIQT